MRLTEIRRKLIQIDLEVQIFSNVQWIVESQIKCPKCKKETLTLLFLLDPFRRDPFHRRLGEIIDGLCKHCGLDFSSHLARLEPERIVELGKGRPILRTNFLCEKDNCLKASVIGIWRGGVASAFECRTCHTLFLWKNPRRRRRQFFAKLSAERRALRREEKALIAEKNAHLFSSLGIRS